MPLYEYECANGHLTEENRRFKDREEPCYCRICGLPAKPVISKVNFTFGFTLSESSHLPGHKDELVRNI